MFWLYPRSILAVNPTKVPRRTKALARMFPRYPPVERTGRRPPLSADASWQLATVVRTPVMRFGKSLVATLRNEVYLVAYPVHPPIGGVVGLRLVVGRFDAVGGFKHLFRVSHLLILHRSSPQAAYHRRPRSSCTLSWLACPRVSGSSRCALSTSHGGVHEY